MNGVDLLVAKEVIRLTWPLWVILIGCLIWIAAFVIGSVAREIRWRRRHESR